MVEILLDSLKADRDCNFEIHIASLRKVLSFFFSMNLMEFGYEKHSNDLLPKYVTKRQCLITKYHRLPLKLNKKI